LARPLFTLIVLHLRLTLLPQPGAGFGLALEIPEGVFQPYFALLEDSIQIVPAFESQQPAKLFGAELLRAVRFQQQGFEGSARKVPPFVVYPRNPSAR
jgi:hypothetical protein